MKLAQSHRPLWAPLLASISLALAAAPGAAHNPPRETNGYGMPLADGSPVETDAANQLRAANAAYASGDYPKALKLFRNIAVLGVPEAHFRLGIMYARGLGTRQSSRQAEYWLALAARENYPGAADALAALRAPPEDG